MGRKALVINTDGTVAVIDPTLDALQAAVGGWVQAVDLTDTLTLWVNEEGKMVGLPYNPYAQALWNDTYGRGTDYLVGNAVITGGTDEDGETLGLDDESIAAVKARIGLAA
jgi:hypothetical protein